MPLPDPANAQPTQSAQELLKGSYWEKFSGDGTLLHALHAYYAALTLRQKAPTNPNSRDPAKGLAGEAGYFSDPNFESPAAAKRSPERPVVGPSTSHIASEPDPQGYRYFT